MNCRKRVKGLALLFALSSTNLWACDDAVQPETSEVIDVSADTSAGEFSDDAESTSDVGEVSEEVSEGPDDAFVEPEVIAADVSEAPEAVLDVVEAPSEAPESASLIPFATLSEAGDVVSFVEVDRYMGLWFEIATTPSFQQASCYSTRAQYSFNEAQGWVDVVNSCRVGSTLGNWQQIQGRAELVDLDTQAKLSVIFFGQSAPYWVVALDGSEGDEPYQWAVVSVPGGQTMWLLSRTEEMTDDLRQSVEAHLIERGFPVETLIDTPHAP